MRQIALLIVAACLGLSNNLSSASAAHLKRSSTLNKPVPVYLSGGQYTSEVMVCAGRPKDITCTNGGACVEVEWCA